MSNDESVRQGGFIAAWDRVIAAMVTFSGAAMALGGIWLLVLGGSPYYVIAGVLFAWAGVLLWRRRLKGAWLFGLAYAISLVWTLYETATRLWGWVPRMGFITGLGFFVAIMLPRLTGGAGLADNGRRWSRILAGACVAFAGVTFALSFIPQASISASAPESTAPLVVDGGTRAAQRAAQANSDWAHYGRDTDATRYSPLNQINADNVKNLQVAWVYRGGPVRSDSFFDS